MVTLQGDIIQIINLSVPIFSHLHLENVLIYPHNMGLEGFPGGSDGKESACSAGDQGLIPEFGRSPEEGNGYPLQCSCLENPAHRGAWWATVHGVTESDLTE